MYAALHQLPLCESSDSAVNTEQRKVFFLSNSINWIFGFWIFFLMCLCVAIQNALRIGFYFSHSIRFELRQFIFQMLQRTRLIFSAARSLCFCSSWARRLRLRNVVAGCGAGAGARARLRDRDRLRARGGCDWALPPPTFCIMVKRSFNDIVVAPFTWILFIEDIVQSIVVSLSIFRAQRNIMFYF